MKTTVIHHSADFDGLFCGEIARKFLPDAEIIGWDFGDPPTGIPREGILYVMDLPLDRPFGCDTVDNLLAVTKTDGVEVVWIDHHASSIASHPTDIPGYRIDGVAACRLAWFYFTALERYKSQTATADFTWFQGHYPWATKLDFLDRKVAEPFAVRLAGEYDIWDKRDPDAETFQYSLRSIDKIPWMALLDDSGEAENFCMGLVEDGRGPQRYAQRINESLVRNKSYRMNWEGLNWIVLNTGSFNSLTFAALDVPETGHDALCGFMFNGKNWTVSLYHAKHRTDLDLSKIAIKHGGGGHKGACGFISSNFPF
jgi:oligoribonuclease NrnB/cAMP/cGMP phosphodiesterase (DHH superfamily)